MSLVIREKCKISSAKLRFCFFGVQDFIGQAALFVFSECKISPVKLRFCFFGVQDFIGQAALLFFRSARFHRPSFTFVFSECKISSAKLHFLSFRRERRALALRKSQANTRGFSPGPLSRSRIQSSTEQSSPNQSPS
jgi:hypothetical protein